MDMSIFSVKNLMYFQNVAKTQSITKSAQDLYISQGHLSRTISKIEHELNVELFEQHGRGIALTPAGHTFYRYTQKIIQLCNETLTETQATAWHHQTELLFATNSNGYLRDTFPPIFKKAPNIHIIQKGAPRKSLITMLRNESVNFVLAAPIINEPDLESILLINEQAIVIYPERHWLKSRSSVTLDEISQETFITWEKGYGPRDCIDNAFYGKSYALHYAIETSVSYLVKQYVEQGCGIAICAKSIFLQDDYSKNHYCNLDESISAPVGLTWRKGYKFTELETLFVELIQEEFQKLSKNYLQPTS